MHGAWLKSQKLPLIKKEFSTPWGVCDLVAAALNERKVAERLALGQRRPIGPLRRVALYHRIPTEHAVTVRTLQREYAGFLDKNELMAELSRLVAHRFVRMPRRGSYQSVNGWVPLQKKIVAVELKLSRVSEAFQQAAAHLCFADESYVALPMDVADRIATGRRGRDFASAHIGLLGVTRKKCTPMLVPNSANPSTDDVLRMHCVERFWRTRVKGNSS